MLVNYQAAYDSLMDKARWRITLTCYSEWHHVLPSSMDGRDHPSNMVLLTAREHYLAHLLLYRMGHTNQIFSVNAMLTDGTNKARKEQLRWKKWVRKWINKETQKQHRERNRENCSHIW
ncbi:HNH endonuclease signature motif containing protein [Roseateles albus]|uniref:HNH endonuclease signature motif containing protein n=1 Tax=Roseateles albus TaxID=2987525 RepID=A0ABT5KJJ9_9BURK|nr:HNH endonuclease signature motif containing protein [Roseateles albus]MDC8773567.1 HNH endonuclease signature motif containing protein [Roseateles albus]